MKEASHTDSLLDGDNLHWLRDFRRRHGRVPRVLHIGNIANNAYNNAKMMNAAGFDCDVLCFDYYHVMGAPEWDDAELEVTPADQFQPDWRAVGIRFTRPRWFVQGRQATCLAYLIARRRGLRLESSRLWLTLAEEARFEPGEGVFDKLVIWEADLARRAARLRARFKALRGVIGARAAVRAFVLEPLGITPARVQVLKSPRWLARVVWAHTTGWRASPHRSDSASTRPDVVSTAPVRDQSEASAGNALPDSSTPLTDANGAVDLDFRVLAARYHAEFPDRDDALEPADLAPYRWPAHLWDEVFAHYDIIQAYSTDPIRPLLAGRRCFAFEHGTLRDIPFQRNGQGRITCLGYRFAEHVFVTNFDCHDNAAWLAPGRFTLINHPYDEDQAIGIRGWERLRAELCRQLNADTLFFFPTRHDWVAGTGYADKANDVFLNAFVRMRHQGFRVGLVLCEWGANVSQSKALLQNGGCSANVLWNAPMAIVRFMRTARASDFVVDQFKLGAMGGIAVRAMMASVPVISHLDEREVLRQYPELPPILNCRTTDQIVACVRPLLEQPHALEERGAASRRWIEKHHAKRQVLNTQVRRYREYLDRSDGLADSAAAPLAIDRR